MESENKKLNVSITTAAGNSTTTSSLSEDVRRVIEGGVIYGFTDYTLSLPFKKVNDNMIAEICEWVIKLQGRINAISLSNNQITSQGASMLFDIFRTTNAPIKKVELNYNQQVGDECMKSLGEYIKSNKNIEEIRLGNSLVSDTGMEILAPYFEGNITFKRMFVYDNEGITDKSIPFLVKIIEISNIEDINVNNTMMIQKGKVYASLACKMVKNGANNLLLQRRDLADDDIIDICVSMKKYGVDKFKGISFERNSITSKGASVLFDTLRECRSTTKTLDVKFNSIDDACMRQLGEYVQHNDYLERLDIDNNIITDKGIAILSDHLTGNTTLKILNIGYNKAISDSSVPYLIEIARKSCISHIFMWGLAVSEDQRNAIDKVLAIPSDHREIPIASNTKSAAKISEYDS